MKITNIEAFHIALPYEHGAPKPLLPTGKLRDKMDGVYLKVETDEGITGWGEAFGFAACPISLHAVKLAIAPIAVGRDANDIASLMRDVRFRTHNMSLNGPVGFALSALDIALWDIKGKIAGQPIWKLLGGDGNRKTIPAYASLIRVREPDLVQRICRRAAMRGYKYIKLHEFTVEAVAAAREAVGPHVGLMLDTNCSWNEEDAFAHARALKPLNLYWLEEPVFPPDDFPALARLRANCGVPIASGENLGNLNDMARMLEAKAVDFVQPDVTKFGGITEMVKAAQLAEKYGVTFEPHSPIHGPGLVATMHLVAALTSHAMCEYYFCDLECTPMGESIAVKNGMVTVPNGPGLGVEIDEDMLRKYQIG
jgi:L-alanine-DL-glutamate epimerase-like enolase superfamily enzyme